MSIESRWKQIHDFLDVELELYHGLYLHKGQGEKKAREDHLFHRAFNPAFLVAFRKM